MTVKTNRNAGFTLVEIMIVVAIIGLLAAIAIPNFVKARETSQKNACFNNMRQIDGAIDQWALEAKQTTGATVVQASMLTYLKGGKLPVCPASGTYTIPAVGGATTCNATGHVLP